LKAAGVSLFARNRIGRVFALWAAFSLMALLVTPGAVAFQSTGGIDLELVKTVSPQSVTVGENVTWTITVPNRGLEDATSVEVQDVFPTGVTYVSHDGHGTLDPSTGIWAIGTIPADEQVMIEIVTSVDGVGDFVNEAEVTMADQDDIDSDPGDGGGDDWDDAVVTGSTGDGELIDLELALTIDPVEVPVGGATTATVDLVNQGPDDATGIAVVITCPADITHVSHGGDGDFDPASNLWTVGNLDVGAAAELDMVITVDTVGEWICGAEVSTADQEDVDSVPGDGTGDDWDDATVVASTGGGELIDLELTLTADPTEVLVGETTDWTVDLINQGPDDATGVAVALACPVELTYVTHGGDGIYDPASEMWAVGDLDVGASVALVVTTTVDVAGDWTCVAEVTAADQEDADSFPGDGTGDDWDDATVIATTGGDGELIDLELLLTADPIELRVGETTTWTVDLVNQGPDDATGVAVAVTCPAQLTYVSHSGDGAFDSTTGVWTVGDLDSGAGLALAITTTVDADGTWICVAEVIAADQEDVDSVPGDGTGDDWDDATVEAAVVQASAIVGDTVWLDADADGIQDAGEAGIAGVTVVLTNVDTNAVVTTATNTDGLYLFAALDAGNYRVEIDMTTVDSELTLTTAGTFTVTLAENDAFLTADFGLAEQLPVTGFDPVPVTTFGLVLVLLGAVALELTWPEREGRRLFVLRRLG
jgi:uncharacterized repeat protein (TIGR01451 family)